MVVIRSWGAFGPQEHRVLPSVTVLEEVLLDAQAFFIWGWYRSAVG